MRIISKARLRRFWQDHPDAEGPLTAWYRIAKAARWSSLADVRRWFPSADGLTLESGAVMTVFNIGGNKYRLVTNIWYAGREVYVKLVLTHAEYSKGRWKGWL